MERVASLQHVLQCGYFIQAIYSLVVGSLLVFSGCSSSWVAGDAANLPTQHPIVPKLNKLAAKFSGLTLRDVDTVSSPLHQGRSSEIAMVLLKDGQAVQSISLQSLVVVRDESSFIAHIGTSSLGRFRVIRSSRLIDQLRSASCVDVSQSYWVAAYCGREFDIQEIKLLGARALQSRRPKTRVTYEK